MLKKIILVSIIAALGTSAWAADLSKADKDFMQKASQAGSMEIKASEMAASTSNNADIKQFAQTMISDHTAVGDKLKSLAKDKKVKLTDQPSAEQKEQLKALSKLDGASFDVAYVRQVGVSAHKDAVDLFDKASNDAKDSDVKSFAADNLPALKHHLEMAQSFNDKAYPAAK